MHQHRTPSRTRFALFAASALALALSLATTTPTAGALAAEQADNDSLSLNGTGRYADQLAQIVLEFGADVAHNPYALLVEFEPDANPADVDALLESAHAALVERFGESDVYLLETRADLDKTQETLEAHPAVRNVAFDTTVHVSTSNDPEAGSLWGLFGTQGINATAAWDLTDTLAPVVVAVIDSGVDTNHPDLAANIWTNPDEIAGNGIDDDGNGLVDDIHGWDFVEDDATPNDPNGHGTHVAGTIAAVRDNGIGVAGVADNAQIMALRFLNAEGSGYTSDALASLEYAIDKGAPISNNSWGGGSFNTALSSLIASNADTHLFVAAAGNSGLNIDSSPQYPAAYTATNILSVAAHNSSGSLASFSNYGTTAVDISAPGVSIRSTEPGTGYRNLSGTSMAAPHAAGVAALLLGTDTQLTPSETIDILLQSGRPDDAFVTVRSGSALDAEKAVRLAGDGPTVTLSGQPAETTVMVGTQLSLTATATAADGTDLSATVTWSNQAGTQLGTGPSLTTTLDEAGSILIIAEATDANSNLGRAQLALDVVHPAVEFTRPVDDVTAVSGETLTVDWTWNGSSDSTALLALAPLTDVNHEVDNGAINDHSTTIVSIDIDDDTTVDDLTVSLRADHTYLRDLTVRLISPSGTEVVLVERRGSSGNDFGSGNDDCTGSPTQFTDNAGQSISTGAAPFSGSWRPEQPLAAFDGESAKGTWELHIRDDALLDTGAVHCVGLTLLDENSAAPLIANIALADETATVSHDTLLSAATTSLNRLVMIGDSFATAAAPGAVMVPAALLPPSAPTAVVAEAGDQSAVVSWSPASSEASAATSFTATAVGGGPACTWTTGPHTCEITGLTNGTPYTFTVTASNAAGTSAASAASAAVTPFAVTADNLVLTDGGDLTWQTTIEGADVTAYEVEYQPIVSTSPSATDDNDAQIVGGYFPGIDATRHIAKLPGCGATIIAPQWIVTAAHCAPSPGDDVIYGLEYWADAYQLPAEQQSGHLTQIDLVHLHPDYNAWTLENDIAVARLATPVNLSAATPIALHSPPAGTELTENQELTVAGWGTTSSGGVSSARLKAATIFVDTGCGQYPSSEIIDSAMFCAAAPSTDSCQGDSGGPVVLNDDNGTTYLAGVVSWGYGCAQAAYPGVYTRVSTYTDWVESHTGPAWNSVRVVTDSTTPTIKLPGIMPGASYLIELTVETTSGSRTLPNTTVRAAERPDPPSPPTAVQADVDGTSATVSWTAPTTDGGLPIVSYTVTTDPAIAGCTTTTMACELEDLQPGVPHAITVTATTAAGTSQPSEPITVTPAATPSRPLQLSATTTSDAIVLTWDAPSETFGAQVTGYTVSASPAATGCTTTARTCTLTGLAAATSYTLSVQATTAFGDGETAQLSVTTLHGFSDVSPTGWQNEAVTWMRRSGITTGCSANDFCPDDGMTREQQITFLWRYAGEPDPGPATPFVDVPANRYFTDAVTWAYNNGITAGVSMTRFGTGETVTRAQAVTFLWRQAGQPAAEAPNPFNDVESSRYFTEPVRWAYANGVTTGTSATTFAPNQLVTRVQFAAFLSRFDGLS